MLSGNVGMELKIDESDVDILREKICDANVPGYFVEFDPVEAELLGAFKEMAISEQDAIHGVQLIKSEYTKKEFYP